MGGNNFPTVYSFLIVVEFIDALQAIVAAIVLAVAIAVSYHFWAKCNWSCYDAGSKQNHFPFYFHFSILRRPAYTFYYYLYRRICLQFTIKYQVFSSVIMGSFTSPSIYKYILIISCFRWRILFIQMKDEISITK